ncbi:MAG: chemotaxis protein CheW [Treponema sp.]|nr:chemotaxis protein CheW [Treponema sp.]
MSEAAETAGKEGEKYLVFSILGRLYTFPTRLIGEVAMFDSVYPLPLVPPYVLGVINRYSIPYALLDIGLLLLNTPSPRGKVLVLKNNIDRIAFAIDDVSGIADIPRDKLVDVERSPDSDDVAEAVSALFSWNGNDVLVLDVQSILDSVTNGEV